MKLSLFIFCLAWVAVGANEKKPGPCPGLAALGSARTSGKILVPPGSQFRNVLIVELSTGQRIVLRTTAMAGLRHAQMWDYLTLSFEERGKILFAGEEMKSPDGKQVWVKDRSRLNDPNSPIPLNESKISNYRLVTGHPNVIERPYSADEPHLHPLLDPGDSHWAGEKIPKVFGVVDIQHDILEEILIGVNRHLAAVRAGLGKDPSASFTRLRESLVRRDFQNLLEYLRFDGVDTQEAEADIVTILRPQTKSSDPAVKRLHEFLITFQDPDPDTVFGRLELQVIPKAPPDIGKR